MHQFTMLSDADTTNFLYYQKSSIVDSEVRSLASLTFQHSTLEPRRSDDNCNGDTCVNDTICTMGLIRFGLTLGIPG